MKKMLAYALSTAMALTMLAGCTTPPPTTSKSAIAPPTSGGTSTSTPSPQAGGMGGMGGPAGGVVVGDGLPDTLENPNISIIYWYNPNSYQDALGVNENNFDALLETIPLFEEKYGGKVTLIDVGWNDMLPKAIELQSAGDAPDLIMIYDRVFHNVVSSGTVMAIDEFVTDADYDFWGIERSLMSNGGKTYAIPLRPYPTLMMFNRDMINMAGLESPDELFKKGEWTFDAFAKIVKATTRYKDGIANQVGFASWEGDGMSRFMQANSSAFYEATTDGKGTSNLGTKAFQTVLDWMGTWASGSETGWMRGGDMFANFDSGSIAIIDGKGYFDTELPFATGLVPYPTGPDFQGKGLVTMPQGMAVPTGAKNAEGAMVFMRMSNQIHATEGLRRERIAMGEDAWDGIFADTDAKTLYAYDKATVNIDKIIGNITNLMLDGVPAATIAEQVGPQLDADLKLTYEGVGEGAVFEEVEGEGEE